jgi:hypothetical protein
VTFTTTPYATVNQVKVALNLQSTQYDSWLTELIVEAQSAIDAEVGYTFQTDGTVASPATRIYNGNGNHKLLIDDCVQVVSVTETVYSVLLGTIASVTSQTLDRTADIQLLPLNHSPGYMLERLSGLEFTAGVGNWSVGGVWGHATIPADITRATVRLTTHYFLMRQTNYADRMSEQGNVRVLYTKEIPKDVMQIIQRYKRTLFLSRGRNG